MDQVMVSNKWHATVNALQVPKCFTTLVIKEWWYINGTQEM
jgi:hypothetical protein